MKLWLGEKLVIVVTRPEDVEKILNNSLEKGLMYKFVIPVFGDGLFTRPVKEWKKHRKVISLTFNQHTLNSFVEIFVLYSNTFAKTLEEYVCHGCFDIFPVMSVSVLDIVCHTMMGTEVDAMKTDTKCTNWFFRASELCSIRLFNIFLHPNFIWKLTPFSKESDSVCAQFSSFVQKIINKKRSDRIESDYDQRKKIFLDRLIQLTDEKGTWTDQELIDETKTLIVSGTDAITSTASFVLMMLGMHPEVQERVYKELCLVLEDGKTVTAEDLPKLVYLERVIKETLRLLPPATIIGRHLTEDVSLNEHVLPKGCTAMIPIISIHKDENVWPDPLKFDPDRFLPEEVVKRHSYSYIPFSAGPRNCIGFNYGMMAVKTMLVEILKTYKVTGTAFKSVSDIKLTFDISTKCLDGYQVELAKRD
ncbi:unnamed protein product [Tenebrio molitor]|nr:unnamed protein product [Tenebrio molitor]